MKRVTIIGGGYSGALTAVNLIRLSGVPLRVTLVNHGHPVCRGVAYSTRSRSHLLNVAARNMSALADQPGHFVEWLRTKPEYLGVPVAALREEFVPRAVYGDYLQEVFFWHCRLLGGPERVEVEVVEGEAIDIKADEFARVQLADGREIESDRVVLATGHQAPAEFRIPGLVPGHPRYFRNPWTGWQEKLPDKNSDVILIGTGLTTIDVFLTLQEMGWQGKIFAVSRNGLLPLSHFKGMEYPDLFVDGTRIFNFRDTWSIFREHYQLARAGGINPAVLVDKLRPLTQRIWQNFSLQEKRQFNRHLRTRWNVVRHRTAHVIHQQMLAAIQQGKLEIIKGRLNEFADKGDRIAVKFRSGRREERWLEGAILINCTGPQESFSRTDSRLFRNLLGRGLIQADDLDMGLKVAPDFSVIGKDGARSELIHAMGPLLKGTLWESTAVPELRSQALQLAEIIVNAVAGKRGQGSKIHEAIGDVVEYAI